MAKTELNQTEQERHRKAFELYYALGVKRSYRQVARQLGVSVSSLKNWSRSFGWRQRMSERDAQTARQLADRTLQSNVNDQERDLKIVEMALMRLARAIADGKVRMQLSDLDRLLRLKALLAGYPEGQLLPDGNVLTMEQMEAYVNSLDDATADRLEKDIDRREQLSGPHAGPGRPML